MTHRFNASCRSTMETHPRVASRGSKREQEAASLKEICFPLAGSSLQSSKGGSDPELSALIGPSPSRFISKAGRRALEDSGHLDSAPHDPDMFKSGSISVLLHTNLPFAQSATTKTDACADTATLKAASASTARSVTSCLDEDDTSNDDFDLRSMTSEPFCLANNVADHDHEGSVVVAMKKYSQFNFHRGAKRDSFDSCVFMDDIGLYSAGANAFSSIDPNENLATNVLRGLVETNVLRGMSTTADCKDVNAVMDADLMGSQKAAIATELGFVVNASNAAT